MTTQKRTTPAQGQPADKRAMFRKLANGLMRLADEKPGENVRHNLKNGLYLVMRRTADGYTLGAWRPGVEPSPAEMEVIRDCFNVPKDAMCSTLQKHRPESSRARQVVEPTEVYLGYVLSWSARKASALSLPGVEPAATT